MEAPQRQALVEGLLEVCAAPEALRQLTSLLDFPEASSTHSAVSRVLLSLAGHRQDGATTSLQMLCRALRNLDEQVCHFCTLGFLEASFTDLCGDNESVNGFMPDTKYHDCVIC